MTPSITMIALDALIPYARNSRTHSDEQVAQIAGSIREFGFTNPVLTDGENGIIAGHGRVLAAQRLGLNEVPCIELAHLSKAQRKAYVIADNKLALNAGWDEDMLAAEFEELLEADFDVELTGFSQDEIDALASGWESDIDVVDKHGENLDGIAAVLKVKTDTDEKEHAQEAIANALEQAGIEYEWG